MAAESLENLLRAFFPAFKLGKTHNLTHTGHRSGKGRTAPDGFSGAVRAFTDVGSQHLGHEGPHLLGGVVLSLSGGVGVSAEGKPRVVVAQHGGHRFCINAVLKGHGGGGRRSTPWALLVGTETFR